ncbi:hypothetical protein GVAV_003439 [Gurleya vavrai]
MMNIKILTGSLIIISVLLISHNIVVKSISSYLEDKTKELNYFNGSRNKNNYRRALRVFKNDIVIYNSFESIENTKLVVLIEDIENFQGNDNKDSEFFKKTVIDSLKEENGFLNISMNENDAFVYFFNNKVAPSHIFYLKEKINLAQEKIVDDLKLIYDNIITKPNTDIGTLRSVARLAYEDYLSQMLVAIYSNSIVIYLDGQIFFFLYINRKDLLEKLKEIKYIKNNIYNDGYTYYFRFFKSYIEGKAIKNSHEVRIVIEMENESLGYDNFLFFTFGKNNEEECKDVIRNFNYKKPYEKLELPNAINIYSTFLKALNHKKTKCNAEIHM